MVMKRYTCTYHRVFVAMATYKSCLTGLETPKCGKIANEKSYSEAQWTISFYLIHRHKFWRLAHPLFLSNSCVAVK